MFNLLAAAVVAVSAQPECAPTERLKSAMIARGAESQFAGLKFDRAIKLEIWTMDNGEWMLFAVLPDGIMCIIDEGKGWVTAKPNV